MKNTNNNGGILNLNINLLCNEYNNTTSLMGENNNDSQSSLDYSKDYSINSIEESSFIVTKKKKRKPKDEMKYVENSPNGKFSRTDQKSYSEKYHISYSGIDNDRGCKIIWHELNVSSIDDEKTEKREYKPFYEIKEMYPRYLFVLDLILQKNINGINNVNIVEFILNDEDLR